MSPFLFLFALVLGQGSAVLEHERDRPNRPAKACSDGALDLTVSYSLAGVPHVVTLCERAPVAEPRHERARPVIETRRQPA